MHAYDRYKYPVQRVDAARYFLMLHYGGIYMDLDNVGHGLDQRRIRFLEKS